jgi:hypothetical protein
MTRRDRRGSAFRRWCRGAASSRAPRCAIRCCSPWCTPTPIASLSHSVLLPYVYVGRHARLRNAVVDRGVRIPEGLVVGVDPEEDGRWFHVRPGGVTLITQKMLDGGRRRCDAGPFCRLRMRAADQDRRACRCRRRAARGAGRMRGRDADPAAGLSRGAGGPRRHQVRAPLGRSVRRAGPAAAGSGRRRGLLCARRAASL